MVSGAGLEWKINVPDGVAEPTKFTHCLKVGLALTLVSLLYYMRPLYESVGKNAMWAVMTVVVVSEYTVASLATFTRFIPKVKARFDYGAMIFILTFSLVSISGYRVDELVMLAHQRLSTVAIGISLCIIISMLCWPVWAGDQLHKQTISNLEKLAISLEAHGHFYFGYPWRQYLKIGAVARSCAYCIDNLNSCIDSKMQAPEFLKNHIADKGTRLSFRCSEVLKELATAIKTRKRSSSIDFSVHKMMFEVEEFQNALKSLPYDIVLPLSTVENPSDTNAEKKDNTNQGTLLEVLPLGMLATLLIEMVARIEEVVLEVDKLANMAEFKIQKEKKLPKVQPVENNQTNTQGQETVKAIEEV
ncbi:Aluminum-activated malate transporter 2 [Bienertia sinuspersici]